MAAGATASHDGRQTGAPSHGPVPGSPTLTNPDMILPDYEMPDSPQGLQSWRDPNLDQMDFQLPPSNGYRSMPPATPIIYGNGTMLSDIGEVTEAESTVGPSSRRASSRYSGYTENETFGPSASALSKLQQHRRSKIGRDRAVSIESTSTITTQDQRATFGDFDDSVSVDDSNFQGDDEESMASGYVEGTVPKSARIRTGKADEGNDQYSTLYISNQAEQILANAKRRLTAMEGNLFRARSSLGYSDGSTPSPQNGQPGSAHRDGANGTAPSHSRIKSDDIREVKQPAPFLQRSASAMGAAGGYRQPSSRSRRNEPDLPVTDRPMYGISQHPLDTTLEPLSEDEDQESLYGDSLRDSAQLSSFLSPTFGAYPERGITRSHSVAQMRDIQDQMQGLRGKISTLKEQARADSMKRRSLQSLRTPSPFTHAQWGLGLMEPRQIKDVNSGDATPTPGSPNVEDEQAKLSHNGVAASDGDESTHQDQKSSSSERQSSSSSSSKKDRAGPSSEKGHISNIENRSVVSGDIDDDMRTENGDAVDEEDDPYSDAHDNISNYGSESGESTYHDSYQEQMSHEDRDDAFDYEHFFLHSAMGSISRQSRRDDTGSEYSSDGSVETTRGPTSSLSRKRLSVETNASDETFATATEGRASRSSAFKSEYGNTTDGGYDELPPLEEVRSNEDEDEREERPDTRQRHNSVLYRPTSATQADRLHRPSVSSFESTGTTRSFPLVNKAKMNGGVLTPGGSPDPVLRSMSEALMGETANAASNHGRAGSMSAPIQGLHKDDQASVEGLVASLGKCVLGLAEASRAGSEGRDYRRRIDAARRILEGLEES